MLRFSYFWLTTLTTLTISCRTKSPSSGSDKKDPTPVVTDTSPPTITKFPEKIHYITSKNSDDSDRKNPAPSAKTPAPGAAGGSTKPAPVAQNPRPANPAPTPTSNSNPRPPQPDDSSGTEPNSPRDDDDDEPDDPVFADGNGDTNTDGEPPPSSPDDDSKEAGRIEIITDGELDADWQERIAIGLGVIATGGLAWKARRGFDQNPRPPSTSPGGGGGGGATPTLPRADGSGGAAETSASATPDLRRPAASPRPAKKPPIRSAPRPITASRGSAAAATTLPYLGRQPTSTGKFRIPPGRVSEHQTKPLEVILIKSIDETTTPPGEAGVYLIDPDNAIVRDLPGIDANWVTQTTRNGEYLYEIKARKFQDGPQAIVVGEISRKHETLKAYEESYRGQPAGPIDDTATLRAKIESYEAIPFNERSLAATRDLMANIGSPIKIRERLLDEKLAKYPGDHDQRFFEIILRAATLGDSEAKALLGHHLDKESFRRLKTNPELELVLAQYPDFESLRTPFLEEAARDGNLIAPFSLYSTRFSRAKNEHEMIAAYEEFYVYRKSFERLDRSSLTPEEVWILNDIRMFDISAKEKIAELSGRPATPPVTRPDPLAGLDLLSDREFLSVHPMTTHRREPAIAGDLVIDPVSGANNSCFARSGLRVILDDLNQDGFEELAGRVRASKSDLTPKKYPFMRDRRIDLAKSADDAQVVLNELAKVADPEARMKLFKRADRVLVRYYRDLAAALRYRIGVTEIGMQPDEYVRMLGIPPVENATAMGTADDVVNVTRYLRPERYFSLIEEHGGSVTHRTPDPPMNTTIVTEESRIVPFANDVHFDVLVPLERRGKLGL